MKSITIPSLPIDIQREIEKYLPVIPSARSSFLNTDQFDLLCRRFSQYHQGEIIRCVINLSKKYRRNRKGVYFNRDPIRPNEYNIGHTKRGAIERLQDTGSKGRHWKTEAFISYASENEVHELLKEYKDNSGRGSETFILDDIARSKVLEVYNIHLP